MIESRQALCDSERHAIYRSRYDIYVEEMGRYASTADHVRRELVDPEDAHSRLFLMSDEEEVVGSFRITWGGDGFSQRQIDQYGLAPFLVELPADLLAVGERTMITPPRRGQDLFTTLGEASCRLNDELGIRIVFGACEPHLLSFYCRYQRPYAPRNINSVEAGYLVPLISFPAGVDALIGLGDEKGLPRCVKEATTGTGTVSSPLLQPPDAYTDRVVATIDGMSSSLFDGFTETEIRYCVAKSNVIACAEGDRLIKNGGTARNIFVLLSGALEVSSGGHPVGVVVPGEAVGEMSFLMGDTRSCDVDALSDDTKVLSLSERTLLQLADDEPAVAVKLLRNLSQLLCRRLQPAGRSKVVEIESDPV